jgi:hypothetical protein
VSNDEVGNNCNLQALNLPLAAQHTTWQASYAESKLGSKMIYRQESSQVRLLQTIKLDME